MRIDSERLKAWLKSAIISYEKDRNYTNSHVFTERIYSHVKTLKKIAELEQTQEMSVIEELKERIKNLIKEWKVKNQPSPTPSGLGYVLGLQTVQEIIEELDARGKEDCDHIFSLNYNEVPECNKCGYVPVEAREDAW